MTVINSSRMSFLVSTFLPTFNTRRYEAGTIDNTKKLVLDGLADVLHVSAEWLKGETEEYESDITMPFPPFFQSCLMTWKLPNQTFQKTCCC